jgi:hypothetical protein
MMIRGWRPHPRLHPTAAGEEPGLADLHHAAYK